MNQNALSAILQDGCELIDVILSDTENLSVSEFIRIHESDFFDPFSRLRHCLHRNAEQIYPLPLKQPMFFLWEVIFTFALLENR